MHIKPVKFTYNAIQLKPKIIARSEVIIALKSVFCLKNANVLPCSMHKLRVLVVDAMDHNRNKISAEL